jgi:hypothetical protein
VPFPEAKHLVDDPRLKEGDPNRRANGTTLEGGRAAPHTLQLRDEGLAANGLATVLTALRERRSRKSR